MLPEHSQFVLFISTNMSDHYIIYCSVIIGLIILLYSDCKDLQDSKEKIPLKIPS